MQTLLLTPWVAHEVWTEAGVASRNAHGIRTGAGVAPGMHVGLTIFASQ